MATQTVARAAAQHPPLAAHDPTELVLGLFHRASDKLTEDDLMNLLNCEEDAKQNLRQLAKVCASVGCLVRTEGRDSAEGVSGRSGAFQSADDVPELLFALGSVVEQSLAMLEVSSQAEIELAARSASAAKGQRHG